MTTRTGTAVREHIRGPRLLPATLTDAEALLPTAMRGRGGRLTVAKLQPP